MRGSHLCCNIALCSYVTLYIHPTGDLKLVEKPSPLTLAPHDFANIKANVKVASTENGIIFGNIGKRIILCHIIMFFSPQLESVFLLRCFILSAQSMMCRELPATETASSSVTSTLTSWTTSSQLPAPTQSSDRCGQSLSGRTRQVFHIYLVAGSLKLPGWPTPTCLQQYSVKLNITLKMVLSFL